MEGFYCHLEPLLAAPVGIQACSDLEAGAMAYECSSSSPPLSMAMEQLQGSFPPSLSAEAADCGGGGGGDKGRRVVSIERSGASTWLGSAAQEIDGSGSSSRKNKRRSNANVAGVKGKRASRGHGVEEEATEEAARYIHVRARRGQATDSHSVAERLRREKINEKMKMLQSLVPGCDKLAGKALLDEIICYVHSLQNQVEFLSMKLAFLNPTMLHELGQDMGSVYHPHAPQFHVLKTAAMPPHEDDPVQWMGQATAPASLAAEAQGVVPTAGLAQTQLQVQQQQEELNSSSSFFHHYD